QQDRVALLSQALLILDPLESPVALLRSRLGVLGDDGSREDERHETGQHRELASSVWLRFHHGLFTPELLPTGLPQPGGEAAGRRRRAFSLVCLHPRQEGPRRFHRWRGRSIGGWFWGVNPKK